MELLEVLQDVSDAAVVVRARGEVDSGTIEMLSVALEAAVVEAASHRTRALVIDLDGLTYFGSAGLNALLNCSEKGRAESVAVRVVATNAEVLRPIEVTRLSAVLRPYPTLAEALATLEDPQ